MYHRKPTPQLTLRLASARLLFIFSANSEPVSCVRAKVFVKEQGICGVQLNFTGLHLLRGNRRCLPGLGFPVFQNITDAYGLALANIAGNASAKS